MSLPGRHPSRCRICLQTFRSTPAEPDAGRELPQWQSKHKTDAGGDGFGSPHHPDRVIGDIGGEVIGRTVFVRFWRLQSFFVFDQGRVKLIRIPSDKSIEVIKSQSIGPTIKGANQAGLPVGNVVIFSKPGVGVTVLAQDFRKCCRGGGNDPRVAGKPGSRLHQ